MHAGFYGTWVEVRRPVMRGVPAALALHPGYGVVVTGHSLGGAVATLAGAYLRRAGVPADVYTYGSPRVGNEAFAAFASTQSGGDNYRLTHSDDPVPRLPPLVMGYRHLTSEYWIEEGDAAAGKPYILSLCPGTANVNCNGAGSGLNVPAHSMYLGKIGACDTVDQMWRRERLQTRANVSLAIEEDALDANGAGIFPLDTREPGLVYLVNMFAERDRQFAATLEGAANYEA